MVVCTEHRTKLKTCESVGGSAPHTELRFPTLFLKRVAPFLHCSLSQLDNSEYCFFVVADTFSFHALCLCMCAPCVCVCVCVSIGPKEAYAVAAPFLQ